MEVGPISEVHGFPLWYKDENGLRLELNVDPNDPFSGLDPLPDPASPVSFPDNFPGEAFYFAAEAEMTTGTGERARLVLALEAAFINEIPAAGDQIVFGRVRIRVEGLTANAEYTVRHPYGVDTFVVEPDPDEPGLGEINFTEDIGDLSGNNFARATTSRIHPFLRWDPSVAPAPPAGYIGDPNVEHPVIGSVILDPQGQPQNYFRIEGPGIGIGSPDRVTDNAIETRNFTLLGKIAVNSGVDVTRATYARTSADGGFVDVFAESDVTPQDIEVSGAGFEPTKLAGSEGRYFARVAFTGATPPGQIIVTNVGDNPDSVKVAVPVDLLTASAVYNTDTQILTVTASSSDTVANPELTVEEFGAIPFGGVLTVAAPAFVPATVTVTSAAGGAVTVAVVIEGGPLTPNPVAANAGADQTVLIGAQVTLDGTGSTGPIATYQWTQVSGTPVVLTGADTATPSFTAPGTAGTLAFSLTVTGASGSASDTVSVTVVESAPVPVADAGPDQTVNQGAVVTLAGSASATPVTFSWTQLSGPPVVLTGADTANPTFTMPRQPDPLVFQLTVTGPGGSSADTVTITPQPDLLTVTRVEFRTGDAEWRVEGTSTVAGPGNTITLRLGNTVSGPVLAEVAVDALGQWSYRAEGAAVAPDATRALTIQSSSGALLAGVPITIRR